MKHVDALSRYPINSLTCDDVTPKIVAAQSKDEYIITIKKLLEEGKTDDYVLKNNVLYKIEKDADVLVVPQTMQGEVIRNAHNKGHYAVSKTESIVKQNFYFPNLRKCVENVVSSCIECILVNKKRGKAEGFLNPIPKYDIPLNTYHIDFIGPLPSTDRNYQHIFTVVDAFTKFVWLYPVKTTSSQNALQKLNQQQAIFGNPARIITDKGPAFTSNEFEEYCKEENIEHIPITTGIPRGNGQIERMHETLIPILAKLSIDDPTKWFKYVDAVQMTMNSTISRSTKKSPFELLTGVKMRNKLQMEILELLEEESINDLMNKREEDREEARKNILKIQEENRKNFNKHRKKARAYEIGDLVAIQRTQFGTGMKLRPKFFGPYEIVKVKSNDRYEVKKIGQHEGPNQTSTAADHMKSWVNETVT
ncbi:blastopia polyprotein [Lasius niger]|uniref:RNA-directed DNA polymerase n=1 Tax=Lasius niger TaxID=67767 RepID=A0A0J7JYW6_LASNI|nr:blastopia polyprotein [Lasius niger]